MQRVDTLDPERFVRLHEAAFNLAARIGDFTVFRNLFAERATITRCEPGRSEASSDVDSVAKVLPSRAVLLLHDPSTEGARVSASYVGSGWPGGQVRGRAVFTLDNDGQVLDLRLEERARRVEASLPREVALA